MRLSIDKSGRNVKIEYRDSEDPHVPVEAVTLSEEQVINLISVLQVAVGSKVFKMVVDL